MVCMQCVIMRMTMRRCSFLIPTQHNRSIGIHMQLTDGVKVLCMIPKRVWQVHIDGYLVSCMDVACHNAPGVPGDVDGESTTGLQSADAAALPLRWQGGQNRQSIVMTLDEHLGDGGRRTEATIDLERGMGAEHAGVG